MTSEIIVKCFRTPGNAYVYDRHTGSLIVVSEEEFQDFLTIERGGTSEKANHTLRRYQALGMFQPNQIESLKHPETDYLPYLINHRLGQLVLQVTQQCNLRCEYCIYSGIYNDHRQHQSSFMTYDIAKKAIDFYLQRIDEVVDVRVGFYGGEPLLQLELIKKCVEYIESRVNGHTIQFNMTTNGTLLTDDAVDFLIAHHFRISISLDGPKEDHNINRKFRSGEGSFDTIMANVQRLKKRYPEAAKDITFMTVINPRAELTHVMEYFDTDVLMRDSQIHFSQMAENSLSQRLNYHESFSLLRRYEYLKMLGSLIGKVDRKKISRLMTGAESEVQTFGARLNIHREIPKVVQHGGPCIAGVRRLFVTTCGDFLPCERVNETSDFCKIGSIDTGFDLKKISDFINIGCMTDKHCKNCWNLLFCSICYGEIEVSDKDKLQEKDVLRMCAGQCDKTLYDLYQYAVLSEFGYCAYERGVI